MHSLKTFFTRDYVFGTHTQVSRDVCEDILAKFNAIDETGDGTVLYVYAIDLVRALLGCACAVEYCVYEYLQLAIMVQLHLAMQHDILCMHVSIRFLF